MNPRYIKSLAVKHHPPRQGATRLTREQMDYKIITKIVNDVFNAKSPAEYRRTMLQITNSTEIAQC